MCDANVFCVPVEKKKKSTFDKKVLLIVYQHIKKKKVLFFFFPQFGSSKSLRKETLLNTNA